MATGRTVDEQRVYWHSRRGMLELDLVLLPFAERVYPTLGEDDRRDYRALLECEDADIFAWLMHRETPDEEQLAQIVERVRAYGRAANQDSH